MKALQLKVGRSCEVAEVPKYCLKIIWSHHYSQPPLTEDISVPGPLRGLGIAIV